MTYLETLLLYAQKHTQLFLKKLILKMLWFVLVFFTVFVGFAYLSVAVFWSFEKYAGFDPIASALLTGVTFVIVAFLFLKLLSSR